MVAADHTNCNIPSSSVMKVWPFFFCSSANFFSLRRLCYKSVYSALIYNSSMTFLIWTIHVCIPLNHVPLRYIYYLIGQGQNDISLFFFLLILVSFQQSIILTNSSCLFSCTIVTHCMQPVFAHHRVMSELMIHTIEN